MQARPLLNTASLWLQTSFRKQARPLLSTASLSLAALWRFGAVPLLEALTLLDALALLEALPLWRFVVLWRLGALRLFDASWRSGNTAAMNTGDGGCVSELAALRLCGFSDPWRWQRSGDERRRRRMSRRACGSAAWRLGGLAALRLCGFAALRLCGLRVPWQLCGFAALRLCGLRVPWRLCGFAALRLERSMAALRLCGFDAFQGARVYPNPRAMVSLCFFFRFRPLFPSSPVLFFRLLSFVCNLSLTFVGLLLTFVGSPSFASLCSSFVWGDLSFVQDVQVLPCSFDSSHSFEILSLSLDSRWKSFFRFSMLFLFFSGLSFVPVLSCSFDSSSRWTPADFRSKSSFVSLCFLFVWVETSLSFKWLSFEVFFRFSLLCFRLELSFVQVLSCSFGSSHSFETSPFRWTPVDFRSKSSFGSLCSFFVWDLSFVQVLSCSFDSSHSFATALFRWTPAGFRLKSFFRFSLPLLSFQASLSFNVLSCSFDSSHLFEIFSLSLDSCCLSFEVLLSFLSALFSFQASLSFKSYLVRSTSLIRLKSSFSLFRSSPVLFRSTPHIRLQPLSFVGLLLTFVRSNSFVSLCSFFVWDLSFVQVLPCSFDSSHSFEILSLSLDSCWLSLEVFLSFLYALFFLFRPLFRSSPVLFVRLLSFVCNLSLSLDSCCLSFEVILSFLSALFSFETSLSFKSCLVRSTPLICLKSSLSRWTPADIRSKSSFVSLCFLCVWDVSFVQVAFVRSLLSFLSALFSFESSLAFKSCLVRSAPLIRSKPLPVVGLRLTFVRSLLSVLAALFFVWDLSFVQVLSCSFDSSHSFATALFRWTPAGFRLKSFFRFSLPFCRFRPLFRSSPILFVRLLSFVWNLLSFVGLLLPFVRSPSFVSLCSFFVSGLSFVQVLSCSFDFSHFVWKPLSFVGLLLTFVGSLSFVSLCSFCSFQASLSFQSFLVRSNPLIRLKSSLSLFVQSPVLFRSTPHIRLQPLSFVGLLLTFVRSNSFVSLCSFFIWDLSFVQVLPCSFDSSHSFEILSLSLDSCWLSLEVFLSFLYALFFFFSGLSFVPVLPCSFDSSHPF